VDNTWKTLRKAAVTMLKAENMDKYRDVQHAEAAQLMYDMMNNPSVSDLCLVLSNLINKVTELL
jgi:hypothetical protein